MKKLLVLLIFIFIASCSKDDDVAVSNAPIAGTLNKTIRVNYKFDFETQLTVPDDTITTLYDNGRIKSVESKKNYFFNKTYIYDSQGRLVKYITHGQSLIVTNSSIVEYIFLYENGHVSEIEEYVSTASGQVKYFSEKYKFEGNTLVSVPIEGWAKKIFSFNEKGQLANYQKISNLSKSEDIFEYGTDANMITSELNLNDVTSFKTNYAFLEGKNPEYYGFNSNLEAYLIIETLSVNSVPFNNSIAGFVSLYNYNLLDISSTITNPKMGDITNTVKDEFKINQDKYPINKKSYYIYNDKMALGHTIDYFYN